jgi:hypothetical protein
MTSGHQEFLANFHDKRKSLVEAVLKASIEECPNLSEIIKKKSVQEGREALD